MYNVFVSYAQPQLADALHLQVRLAMPNVSVFVAEHDLAPGESLSTAISAEIKACDLFIVLWTEDAARSQYVNSEIFLAKTERRRILPLVLKRGVPIPPILGDVKYLDATEAHEESVQWLTSVVQTGAQSKARSQAIALGVLGFLFVAAISRGE